MFEKVYPQTLRIEVIQEDIISGIRGQQETCPIALAIKRMYPDEYVSVGGRHITVDGATYLSDAAGKFVNDFDNRGVATPCIIEAVRE